MTSRMHLVAAVVVISLLASGLAWGQQSSGSSGAAGSQSAGQSSAAGSSAAGSSYGQQSTSGQSAGQMEGGARAIQPNPELDRTLATLLTLGNQAEIELGQFAQGRASSDAVKQFARQMIQDHTNFIDQMQQAVLRSRGQGSAAASASAQGASQNAAAAGTQPGEALIQAGVQHDPLLSVTQQAGQRIINLTQQELGRHQGAQFDAAYVGQQLMAHVEMLAKLQTAQGHVTPEFRQVIDQGIQTTEQHLGHARELMQQLQQQMAATARRQSESRSQ